MNNNIEFINKIIDLAIHGKLIKNDPTLSNDMIEKLTNAKDYLEKNKLILKKSKIYDKDIIPPFDIPSNWKWSYLCNVSIIQEGAGIRKFQYTDDGIQLFSVTNILDGAIDLEKKQLFVSEEEYLQKYKHLTLNKGDIVTACSGGSWGKVAIYDNEATVMLNTSTLRMRFFNDIGCNKYLYYVTKSNYFKGELEKQLVGMQPNLGYKHYSQIPIPIPPLEEQQLIADKLDELFDLIEKKSLNDQEMDKLIEDLKMKSLNSAFKAELVSNNPSLLKISNLNKIDNNDLYNIPSNWTWTSLDSVLEINTGLSFKKDEQSLEPDGCVRVLRGGNINLDYSYSLKFDDIYVKKDTYQQLLEGDIITPSVTSMEQMCKTAIIDKDLEGITAGGFVYIMRVKNDKVILPKYAMYFVSSGIHKEFCIPNINKSGQAFYNLKKTGLEKQPIPIPPLEEQQKIVDKLDILFGLSTKIIR